MNAPRPQRDGGCPAGRLFSGPAARADPAAVLADRADRRYDISAGRYDQPVSPAAEVEPDAAWPGTNNDVAGDRQVASAVVGLRDAQVDVAGAVRPGAVRPGAVVADLVVVD